VIEVSVSRVCIHADRDGDPLAVDVALPSGAPVAELLPAIVELVDDRMTGGDAARRWRLERPSGGSLEESLSLDDNGVRDGELLILSPDRAPTLGPMRRAAWQEAMTARPSTFTVGESLPGAVCLLTAVLAAASFAWTAGSASATTNAIIAGVGAAAAMAVTVVTGYATASSIAVVSLASATGFLAVPSGPAAPNVFLAAVAAFTAALLMLRLAGRVSPALVATAALSLLAAVVTLVAMPVVLVGAALSTASLALLTLAPRLSVLTARLGSEHWQGDAAERAVTGHATLTGLVAGCAAGAATGAVVVAIACRADPPATVAFTAVIATALFLRARTYIDAIRQIALITGGLASAVAGLHVAFSAYQGAVGPVACVLVVIGLIAVRRPRCGAAVARLVDLLDYAALAAVVPVACWVGGGFHLS
jgi:type VII secretion integral membrane protein EccD